MKASIIFYSYSGNTRKVALILRDKLIKKWNVDLIDIQAIDESRHFFGQVFRALFKKKAMIKGENLNLNGSDVICIGTPVWAANPAPAIRSYLEKSFGYNGKKIVLFTTYGSGFGVKACLSSLKETLESKKPKEIRTFSIQQGKVDKELFIKTEIAKIFDVIIE